MENWDACALEKRELGHMIGSLNTPRLRWLLEAVRNDAEKASEDLFMQHALGKPVEVVLATQESIAEMERILHLLKMKQEGQCPEEEWLALKERLSRKREYDLDSDQVEDVIEDIEEKLQNKRFSFEQQGKILVLPKVHVDLIIRGFKPGEDSEEELREHIKYLVPAPSSEFGPEMPRVYATWLENLQITLDTGCCPNPRYSHPRWFASEIEKIEREIARREQLPVHAISMAQRAGVPRGNLGEAPNCRPSQYPRQVHPIQSEKGQDGGPR